MLKMEIGVCKNAKKNQISYLPILSYFLYVIFDQKCKKHLSCNLFWVKVKYRLFDWTITDTEAIKSTKPEKTFGLKFNVYPLYIDHDRRLAMPVT